VFRFCAGVDLNSSSSSAPLFFVISRLYYAKCCVDQCYKKPGKYPYQLH
jgi:hypothetical protein